MNSDPINPYAPPQTDPRPTVPSSDRLEPVLGGVAWPLTFHFKILTFAPKVIVRDATGREVMHVRQRLFKFREHVELFTDSTRATKLGEIRADRVIDWSARYAFTDAAGEAIGSVGRKGWRSLWRAHYDVFNPGDAVPDFVVSEENPFAKVMDGIFGQIPFLGLITLWLFHPSYAATSATAGTPSMRLTKLPAFLEGRFRLDLLVDLPVRQQMNLILSFFMLSLLERRRG